MERVNTYMANNNSSCWVAVVYNDHDKVASRNFKGGEDDVYNEAKTWVRSRYKDEKEFNWELHKVHNYTR